MKHLVKKALQKAGVLNHFQSALHELKFRAYQNTQEWHLDDDGLQLVYDTSDMYSRRWFYPRYGNGRLHEPTATSIFKDNISEDSIVMDIGAHLGYFTCIAGKLAPNGKVYAFDVDPKCLELITNNAKLNGLDKVAVHNLALSDHEGFVNIKNLITPNPGIVINPKRGHDFIEVKSTTLDLFTEAHNISPDFIKIDVEGAEGQVLKGMDRLLKQQHLILLVEIHVNHLQRYFQTDYRDIIGLLMNHDFHIQNIDHRLADSSFRAVDHTTSLKRNTMLLCQK